MPVIGVVLTVLFLVAFVGGVTWLILKANREQKATVNTFRQIAATHGEPMTDAGTLAIQHGGLSMRVNQSTGKHAQFTLAVSAGGGSYPETYTPTDADAWEQTFTVETQPQIVVHRENVLDRLGKLLRINREVQLGDARFDRALYITTEAPNELVLETFKRSEVRQAVLDLFDAGFTELTLYGPFEPVRVTIPHAAPSGSDNPETHQAHLNALHTISRGMPPVQVARPGTVRYTLPGIITASSIAAFFVVVTAALLCDTWWQPFGKEMSSLGITLGLGAWLVCAPVLLLLTRGRSNTFSNLLISLGCLFVTLPMLASFTLKATNGALDSSAVEVVHAPIVSVRKTSGKSTSYYVTVASNPRSGPRAEFTVNSKTYTRAKAYKFQGGAAPIRVRAGFWGWTWFDGIDAE